MPSRGGPHASLPAARRQLELLCSALVWEGGGAAGATCAHAGSALPRQPAGCPRAVSSCRPKRHPPLPLPPPPMAAAPRRARRGAHRSDEPEARRFPSYLPARHPDSKCLPRARATRIRLPRRRRRARRRARAGPAPVEREDLVPVPDERDRRAARGRARVPHPHRPVFCRARKGRGVVGRPPNAAAAVEPARHAAPRRATAHGGAGAAGGRTCTRHSCGRPTWRGIPRRPAARASRCHPTRRRGTSPCPPGSMPPRAPAPARVPLGAPLGVQR